MDRVIQLSGAGRTAGIIIRDGTVVKTAPIFRWMIGMTETDMRRVAERNHLTVEEVSVNPS